MLLHTPPHIPYRRLLTKEVKVGPLIIGGHYPIRVQTMTTTNTLDTLATVEQIIRCINAGAELVRITAPSKKEAENLLNIKNKLRQQGYTTPLIADIHFTPHAAEIATTIVEKVRINPGNYVDKKKFEQIDYTDAEYLEEIERIKERFTPLVKICKQQGTALRIGTNHGSLSDRIMSRYGDTAIGMVESAMEFLRIARAEDYHQIILSMKSSNPLVMVQAYRLLVQHMVEEFGECYPLHLGVTEAGDGEEGRIKSAIGIGTLLQEGIGDTIRVSLTEDPEFEIPVCMDIVNQCCPITPPSGDIKNTVELNLPNILEAVRLKTFSVKNIGAQQVPIVIADFMLATTITQQHLQSIGYTYNKASDKWNIADTAADYIYTANKKIDFALPGTLKIICNFLTWAEVVNNEKYFPLFTTEEYLQTTKKSAILNFISINADEDNTAIIEKIKTDSSVVLCVFSSSKNAQQSIKNFVHNLIFAKINCPLIICIESHLATIDEQLINFSIQAGALLLDGIGNGIWLMNDPSKLQNKKITGRTYLDTKNNHQFINNTSFSILQAVRTRISKTEYISCPSCGRTLFDLQETTAKIRAVTHHLKGLKIAVMGCIVNGPGEMADADYGYVGSGIDKITLYKGKEIKKRNIDSTIAVEELINLIKENGAWINPQ